MLPSCLTRLLRKASTWLVHPLAAGSLMQRACATPYSQPSLSPSPLAKRFRALMSHALRSWRLTAILQHVPATPKYGHASPPLQARFAVVLSAPPAPFVVLSNMPLQSTRNRTDGLAEYTFETLPTTSTRVEQVGARVSMLLDLPSLSYGPLQVSPPMSTYLLAWVIGELASVETVDCAHMHSALASSLQRAAFCFFSPTLYVCLAPDASSGFPILVGMLGTALSVGCTALMTLSTTFGVPYALPKLDLVRASKQGCPCALMYCLQELWKTGGSSHTGVARADLIGRKEFCGRRSFLCKDSRTIKTGCRTMKTDNKKQMYCDRIPLLQRFPLASHA
eukprot:scaffold18705_cov20-Tisochrysis_lutea.AAC.2